MLEDLQAIPPNPFIRSLVDRLRGEIQTAEGRLDEALQSFIRAKEYSAAPSDALARALMRTAQWERAAAEFSEISRQKAAMLFPRHGVWFAGAWVQALYDAGLCSLESNNPEEAKQYFRQYLWVMEGADASFETPQKAEILLTGNTLK
jgi:tetratricopeptide (TPR) repeat protein